MNKIILLILILGIYTALFSQTTYTVKLDGTGNFTSIQAAINATVHGDTIIVHNGRYFENINYNGKNIYLTSLFKYSNDRNDIYSSIIDANQQGTGVIFENYETRNAVINGFVIENAAPLLIDGLSRSGGIGIWCSSPSILNCIIKNNTDWISSHGGLVMGGLVNIPSNPFLSGNIIKNNITKRMSGGINIGSYAQITFDPINKNSIFGNKGGSAQDIHSTDRNTYLEIILDTFTVHPSNYEFYNHIDVFNGQYTFQADNYSIDSFINHDLYVSPLGDDDLNDGLSWVSPFKTVAHAMYWIASDIDNPKTIYLAEGVYKPSEGQIFPFVMKSYVTLQGAGPELTIFDSEQTFGFIASVKESRNFIINGITFQNNSHLLPYRGMNMLKPMGIDESEISNSNFRNGYWPIMMCGNGTFDYSMNENANAIFKDLLFDNNIDSMIWPYIQKATFENITIKDRNYYPLSDDYYGSLLIYAYYDPPYRQQYTFSNLLIYNNQSHWSSWWNVPTSSAFGFSSNKDILINNSTIVNNYLPPGGQGGPVLITDRNTNVKIYNSIIYNNTPNNLVFENGTTGGTTPSRYYVYHTNLQGGENSFIGQNSPYAEIIWGEGNQNQDPLFLDNNDDEYPYQLSDNSPGIDAGTLDIDWDGYVFPETDIMGNPRIVGGQIDMGAYQTQHLRADFTAEPLSGDAPLTVQFTSIMSEGDYTYEWDFDLDGVIDSIDENPSFTYTQHGLYSVRLIINNGEKQVIKIDYINVGDVSEIDINLPAISDISEPYPNPFRGKTMFKANINEDGMVSMIVYNIRGQRVKTIINERKTVGIYQIVWDGKNDKGQYVASGIYTIEMKFNNKRIGNVKVSFIK